MQALAQQGVPGVVAGAAQPDGGCGGLGARADAGQVVEQAGRAGRVRGRTGGPQISAAAHVAGDVGVVGGRRGDGLPQPGQRFQQGLVDGVGEGVAHLAEPGGRGGDQVVGDGGGGGCGGPRRQHGGVEQAAQVGQGGIAQIDGALEEGVEAGLGVLAEGRGNGGGGVAGLQLGGDFPGSAEHRQVAVQGAVFGGLPGVGGQQGEGGAEEAQGRQRVCCAQVEQGAQAQLQSGAGGGQFCRINRGTGGTGLQVGGQQGQPGAMPFIDGDPVFPAFRAAGRAGDEAADHRAAALDALARPPAASRRRRRPRRS
jgi:hypothetical protein